MSGSPLLFLTICSFRNRLRTRLRRLREPRYLIATVLGVVYFYFLFGRRGDGAPPGVLRMMENARTAVELGSASVLFVTAVLAWFLPSRRPALAFSLAEVQHLFTAPISRRRLLRYRMLRSQIGVVISSAITTFFLRPADGLQAGMAFLGLVLLMTTINLHLNGVSLSRARAGTRRRVLQAVAAAAALVVIGTIFLHWQELSAIAARGGSVVDELSRLGTTGAAGVVLWPFRALVRLPLADSPTTFGAALPAVLVLIALNYVWVLRTDVPFEEASAELSARLDDLRRRGPRALRSPRATRTPFVLSPHGRPEVAIFWKNLISTSRGLSIVTLVRLTAFIVLFATMLSRGRGNSANLLTGVCLFVAGFTLLLGPQMARNDLRQDLTALAVLKTWPIRGAALVRGELLAPAAMLTAIIFLALVAAAVFSTQAPFAADVLNRWSLLFATLLVTPGLVLAQLLMHNGLAVTFPSWVAIGARPGGVDVVGQRLIVMMGVLLALVIAVLPAAIVAGVVSGLAYLVIGTVPVVLGGIAAGATLLVEAFIGSEFIGAILERSDISAIDAPES